MLNDPNDPDLTPLDYPLSDTIALLIAMRMTEIGEATVDSLVRIYPTPLALVN